MRPTRPRRLSRTCRTGPRQMKRGRESLGRIADKRESGWLGGGGSERNSLAIGGLLTSANDNPRAKPPEQLQDSGKGDCSGCSCGFRLRTNAESSVMTSPIGKGLMNVNTALKNGFLYSSLYL